MSSADPRSWAARAARYLEREIWEKDLAGASRVERLAVPVLRIGYLLVRGYSRHHLTVRASALTYITIVSLVPTIAVAFAMFKAFGGLEHAEQVLLPRILDYLAVGVRDDVAGRVTLFLRNINSGAVGGISTLFLFLSAIFMLSSMENAFNEIWGVRRDRSLFQGMTLYWTVLTIAPTLMLAAMALPSVFRAVPLFAWGLHVTGTSWLFFSVLLPVALVCITFSVLYGFVPNTHVRFSSAVIGGVVGGILWSAAVSLYAWYAGASVSYSKIYGSLSAIPIFLLWLYITWLIILFGAEVSFAVQNVSAYASELRALNASQATRELLALRIMSEVSRRFLDGEPPVTADALAAQLTAPLHLVNDMVNQLLESHLVHEFGDTHALLPARDPERLSPADLLRCLRERGEVGIWAEKDSTTRQLEAYREQAEDAARQAWGSVSFAELASNGRLPAKSPAATH